MDLNNQDSEQLAHLLMEKIAGAASEEKYREYRDQLWTMGDGAIPVMRSGLHSRNARQRMACACNLGRLGDVTSLPDIINLLHDPVSTVREMALFGLGVMGRPRAIGPILDCRHDYDPDVRVRVLVALHDLRYTDLESVLIEASGDDAYGVREQALSFLRSSASPASLFSLVRYLLEPEYKMQIMSEATLDRILPDCTDESYAAMEGKLAPRQTRLVMNYLEGRNLHEVWVPLYNWLRSQISRAGASTRGLDRYGRILNNKDELDLLDRAFLRDDKVDLLYDHFTDSESKRSILLIGPAGTGKTATVHQFVRRLVEEDSAINVLETNTSELMTDTRYLGEWETKLKKMMEEISKHDSIILYVKNPNDLLGAGAHSKSDESFADFFRPYMERGNLRMIAETTPEMLKSGLGKDPGFLRLFQQVHVSPMSEDETTEVLTQLLPHTLGRGDRPMEADRSVIEQITDFARSFYTRAEAPGRACDLFDNVVEYVGRKRAKETDPGAPLPIYEEDIPQAIAQTTGMDLALLDDQIKLDLGDWRAWFEGRLIAQDSAIDSVMDRVALIKAGMRDVRRPMSTLFMVGPTGVGKTYFARLVAERLFGDPERMVRFDLSEYQGSHALERLIGSPHEKDREGLLTEAIRHQPYCVLLLDEFEKAHPAVYNLFLQMLDEGRLTDARGRTTDFRQTLIMMTSNLGASRLSGGSIGFEEDKAIGMSHQIRRKMEEVFQPEFLNRLDEVLIFNPLDKEAIRQLVDLETQKMLQRRGFRRHNLQLSLSDKARDWLSVRGFSPRFGARELKRTLEKDLLTAISRELLHNPPTGRARSAQVDIDPDGKLSVHIIEALVDRPQNVKTSKKQKDEAKAHARKPRKKKSPEAT